MEETQHDFDFPHREAAFFYGLFLRGPTNMTMFGLTIWAYELTGSATALAMVGFFFVAPMLVVTPFAGAIVDRSNRKFMMMISDLATGLITIIIFFLMQSDSLEIWHLYLLMALSSL